MEKLTRTVAATLAALKRRGLILRTFAREAGHDPSLVSRLAKGERNATPVVARFMAKGQPTVP